MTATAQILLVEDHAFSAKTIVSYLSRQGFSVVHAADPDAAKAILNNGGGLFLVILDLVLPPTNRLEEGLSLARYISDMNLALAIKFISSYTEQVDTKLLKAFDGFDGFHEKPLDFPHLLRNVRSVCHKKGIPLNVVRGASA